MAEILTTPSAFDFSSAVAVTPHDTNNLAKNCRALYIGGAGNVTLIPQGSSTAVAFNSVPAGTVLRVCATIVKSTGTTATGIVALI